MKKILLRRLSPSGFLGRTLRVNEIAMKTFSKISCLESTLNCRSRQSCIILTLSSLSGHVEWIFVHKNWKGGYWQHLASTGRRYVPHSHKAILNVLCPVFEDNFSSKMSKERPLQSMAIAIGPCWTNFCSQKLKRRILATFGFNRTTLCTTELKLHSTFYALFLKITL